MTFLKLKDLYEPVFLKTKLGSRAAKGKKKDRHSFFVLARTVFLTGLFEGLRFTVLVHTVYLFRHTAGKNFLEYGLFHARQRVDQSARHHFMLLHEGQACAILQGFRIVQAVDRRHAHLVDWIFELGGLRSKAGITVHQNTDMGKVFHCRTKQRR